MGTFSPSPFYTKEVDEFCRKYIYQATVDAMKSEEREFKGIIFFGLMLTADGPKVLEYNARFGDPETQVVLPRMKNDIVDVFEACVDGTLDQIDLQFEDNAAGKQFWLLLAIRSIMKRTRRSQVLRTLRIKMAIMYSMPATSLMQKKYSDKRRTCSWGNSHRKGLKEARANAYKATRWIHFENANT